MGPVAGRDRRVARRVELFEAIRRDRRLDGLSIRALAARHRVHRRTVRQALASAFPPSRRAAPRPQPAIEPWKPIIDAWLEADRSPPRKQRHTARRVWQRLGAEYGAMVSEVTVSRYVRHQPGPGSVPRRSRRRVRCARWGSGADPLRQPQGRGVAGLAGPQSGRGGAVRGAAQPLRVRQLLLPPRGSKARTRRAGSRARSAGSVAVT